MRAMPPMKYVNNLVCILTCGYIQRHIITNGMHIHFLLVFFISNMKKGTSM